MHLVCRPRLGRIAPRTVCFNTTSIHSGPESATKSSHHIAKSWRNIEIPSREDVLRNPHAKNIVPHTDDTKSYKPDLRYLNQGTATSLASRLAHKLEKPQAQNARERISPSSNTQFISGAIERPVDHTVAQWRVAQKLEKPQLRRARERISPSSNAQSIPGTIERPVDHTIAQRRAARLAREAATHIQPSKRSDAQRVSLRDLPANTQIRSGQARRQFDGSDVFVPNRDGLDQVMSIHAKVGRGGQYSGRANVSSSDKPRAEWNARRGSPQGSGGTAAGGRAVRGGLVPSRMHTPRAGEEDISLEELENGGDEKDPAEFKGPDATFADLDDVFRRLAPKSYIVPPSEESGPRQVQETSGGDYVRFAPYSSRDFVVPHRKMSPAKHVQLVLSKRGDVPIIARHRALGIVRLSIGQSGMTSAR